jgi:hypothetical protein
MRGAVLAFVPWILQSTLGSAMLPAGIDPMDERCGACLRVRVRVRVRVEVRVS